MFKIIRNFKPIGGQMEGCPGNLSVLLSFVGNHYIHEEPCATAATNMPFGTNFHTGDVEFYKPCPSRHKQPSGFRDL